MAIHAGAAAGTPLFVPVAAPADIVLDPARGAEGTLYVTTHAGTVAHYDVAARPRGPGWPPKCSPPTAPPRAAGPHIERTQEGHPRTPEAASRSRC